jgi:hypothetical protein
MRITVVLIATKCRRNQYREIVYMSDIWNIMLDYYYYYWYKPMSNYVQDFVFFIQCRSAYNCLIMENVRVGRLSSFLNGKC